MAPQQENFLMKNAGTMKRFTLLLKLLIILSVNFSFATIYYSIDNGRWTDNTNWSTSGYGGGGAGAYPTTNDTAYIRGVEIIIDDTNLTCKYIKILGSGSENGKLEIWDGYALIITGDLLLDADNGSKESHLHLKEDSDGSGGGILTIQGDVLAYRNGGSDDVKIKVDDNSNMTVNGDLTLDSDGGSKKIEVSVKDDGQLNVNGDFIFDYSGGLSNVEAVIEDNAIVDVDGYIYFISDTQAKILFELNNSSTLNIAGNFIRQADPDNYGVLNCKNSSTVVYDGSLAQIVAEDAGAGTDYFNYQNVTINNSFGTSPQLTLEGDATVNGALTMTDGVLKVGADNIIIGTGGTTAGGSINSYVDVTSSNGGKKVKLFSTNSSINFLVGDANDYSPFTFTKNSSTGGTATISVDITDALHPNLLPGDLITRYWTIDASGLSSLDYDVSYVYQEADVSGTEVNLYAARWNGSAWSQYNNVNEVTNTLSSNSGITEIPSGGHDFSAGNGFALPIKLLSFSVEEKDGSAELKWTTSIEINNDFFTLERSIDGISYEEIAIVDGFGTSYQNIDYKYTDHSPLKGQSYYRLKQTDFDGEFEYTEPISFILNTVRISNMKIFPNPLSPGQELTLEINESISNEEVLVVLFNSYGQEVYSKVIISESNGILTGIDVSNRLAPGVYLITASSKDEICQQKLIIGSKKSITNLARK